VVLAAFGGMTPEKRIPSLLRALSTTAARHPRVHLLLVGEPAAHYGVRTDAARWGIGGRVHVTGYVADDRLAAYLTAADLCACLRWPTNRETSASWLRCLAAGRVTLISDLADLGDVPTLDPRGWRVLDTAYPAREPVAVSIDVVDEDHSLQLALDGLIDHPARRQSIARAARNWWAAHHQLPAMADAYDRVLSLAASLPAPTIALPAHLIDDASARGRAIAREMGVDTLLADIVGRGSETLS
jgi:glycosyltransferase involved in cell wall biosynthesis